MPMIIRIACSYNYSYNLRKVIFTEMERKNGGVDYARGISKQSGF